MVRQALNRATIITHTSFQDAWAESMRILFTLLALREGETFTLIVDKGIEKADSLPLYKKKSTETSQKKALSAVNQSNEGKLTVQ